MTTKFFTNRDENSLYKKFKGVFENVPGIQYFDALVGYFRASGYFQLRPFLNNIPKIRILVGINVDKLVKQYHEQGLIYMATSEETKAKFLEEIIQNIQEADYDQITEDGIIQFIEDLGSGKIEMRANPKKKIHAKVYIFRPASFNEHAPCEVITGSSNLTNSGMGANPESNYEFNVSLRDYDDVKFATDEFEELWKESEPILKAEADKIKKGTFLRDDFTPFELYIKTLIQYFGNRIDYDPYNIDLLLPDKYIRLKYQSDAANQGYAIMRRHNGFILADVVGLGKTIVACMVAKKFIYENGNHTNILLVVPPALKKGWIDTIEEFQIRKHFYTITLGSLDKILDEKNYHYPNADKYDMVIIDESHKFRNADTNMYEALQRICKYPRSRPAEDGDTRKKIMMLSATPLNNKPADIENQLYLFQDKRNSTLDIRNLQGYFKYINDHYKKLTTETELNIPALKKLFERLRNDIIEPLVIRRTRTDIEKNKDYLKDMEDQNLVFPKVSDPFPLYYDLKGTLSELFYETVSVITGIDENGNKTDGFGYFRYRAIEFLANEKDRNHFGNVGQISQRLSGIMKTMLIKRLESSFYAFTQSLIRLQTAIQNMIDMFDKDTVFVAPDLDVNKLLDEGCSYEAIEAKINEKGGNNRTFNAKDFDPSFYTHLLNEKAQVDILVERWEQVKTDPKLTAFSKRLKEVFFNPEHNHGEKLVIFTEAKETASQLAKRVEKSGRRKPLVISADNRREREQDIVNNFDANLEEEKWKDDYNIIITTEVLAEGINLHRSNVIVNYDVPWNSTRLMQRIGRVNRIGSRSDKIYVYNFYPSAQGDDQIRLVNTALRKLQAFHTAFGEDNKVFSLMEETNDSDKPLFGSSIQREESEILKYLNELRDFKEKNPEHFAKIYKIPNKARCARVAGDKTLELNDNEGNITDYSIADCSVSYLKSKNHPGTFCLVTEKNRVLEVSFLQAIKVLKAETIEQTTELPESHYTQTKEAFQYFKQTKAQEQRRQPTAHNLSIPEKNAIKNLNAFINLAPTKQKQDTLQRAISQIREGVFVGKGLPKLINDFFKKELKTTQDATELIEKLFDQVFSKYDFSQQESTVSPDLTGVVDPEIILTQSFVSND